MDYRIAIPSYRRASGVREKTLAVLSKHNIDPERVTVFVANEQEYDDYAKELKNTPYKNIVVGEITLQAQRRVIQKYYPVGTNLVCFDDDVYDVLRKVDDKTVVPVENLEEQVIFRGFNECIKHNAYLFGVYAVNNPMFMKNRVSVGLYFCVGALWGVINRHDSDLVCTIDEKEDYQRTLQHYLKDGAVIRLDDVTIKTKYYNEPGGMQGTDARKEENITKNAKLLAEQYPDLCTMYIRESKNRAELRLRDTRPKVEVGATLEDFFG
jgi:hypothetical protein